MSLLNTSHVWFRGFVKCLYLQFYHDLVCIRDIKSYRITQRNPSHHRIGHHIPHISSSLPEGQYIVLHIYIYLYIYPTLALGKPELSSSSHCTCWRTSGMDPSCKYRGHILKHRGGRVTTHDSGVWHCVLFS